MNSEEIRKAIEILKQPITVNCVDYYYFTQEQYNNLVKVYENALWLLNIYEKLEDKYIHNVPCCNEEDCELYKENQQLHNKIDKAIDVIHTQMKNNHSYKENLNIIENNLIKGSCKVCDLKDGDVDE